MITRQDDINLTDSHFFAKGDIHDLFKRMRAEDPVHWTQGSLKRGFWSIFKHQDAYTVYRGASEYFSNGKFGVGLPSSPEIEAATSPQITGSDRMLVASDGELHRDFRKIVQCDVPAARNPAVRRIRAQAGARNPRRGAAARALRIRHRGGDPAADGDHLRHDGDSAQGLAVDVRPGQSGNGGRGSRVSSRRLGG